MSSDTQKLSKYDSAHASEQSLKTRQQAIASIRSQTRNDASQAFLTSPPLNNGDQEQFERMGLAGFASFTKALAHDSIGLVDVDSFHLFLKLFE